MIYGVRSLLKKQSVLRKNNILFLTTGLGLGGAERVVLDICKNIDKQRFNFCVIGISTQKELLSEFNNTPAKHLISSSQDISSS